MILFLDYDGVLHPDAVYLEKGRGPVLRAEGKLFMWAPHLVEALAPHSHVKIVLSTSWVRRLRFARARRYLPDALQQRVIGATWHSTMGHADSAFEWEKVTRYGQIARYVKRAGLESWIAIDDHAEGWSEANRARLIHTDSMRGLSDTAAIDALVRAITLSDDLQE